MSFSKIMLLALVVAVMAAWLKRRRKPPTRPSQTHLQEKMVRCCQCQAHIPISRAFEHNDEYVCQEHKNITDNP